MNCRIIICCIALLVVVSAAHAVVVDGVVRVNSTDQSGVWVIFYAASPSARTDSVLSNSTTTTYSINVQPGVYNVVFSCRTFASYRMPGQVLLFNTTLPFVELFRALSGPQSGELGTDNYQVIDSISVDSGQTLIIDSGTRLQFEPRTAFIVRGNLQAVGLENDSIVFTKRYASPDSTWGGMQFLNADNATQMGYCVVEQAYPAIDYNNNCGGGVRIFHCSPSFSHCSIRRNLIGNFYSNGGGIGCVNASPVISECDIVQNVAGGYNGYGGGLSFQGLGNPVLDNCRILDNRAYQLGGGVSCSDSVHALTRNCLVVGNFASIGGGAEVDGTGSLVTNCVFREDSAQSGGALDIGNDAVVRNCIIEANYGLGAVYASMAVRT